ncbi:aminotransferase class V-fold PLP-dependent enzyme [Amycolatopsis jejuensis]|uniref:aminotransferase class V-fold PLP-dependent enzyme n=1 Tax=Amycolatopsis jejuensis TaxID=330084 RepID=UPI000527B74D|nr:aminotransferase class V-fold PLP-dependent enzyme [Amycolatopsis jejuensis]
MRSDDRPAGLPFRVRDHFPYAKQAAYLNSAAIGLVPSPVRGQVEVLLRDIANRGTSAYLEAAPQFSEAPREAGARLFNAEPGDIALVTSASEVMNQIALSLRPGRGANIVTVDTEVPAVTFPWIRLAEDTGLEVRIVDTSADRSELTIERIAELVDDDTAVIAVSLVEWVTGHRFDLTALADLAHAHGAIAAVDCYQAAGVVPLDVTASRIDLAVAGSFKWLCGFSTAAVCYLHPALSERIRPALAGSVTSAPKPPYDHIDGTVLDYAAGARRLEYGSGSTLARFSLGLSIDYLLDIGIEHISEHVAMLTDRLAGGVDRLGGRVITPRDRKQRGGILSVEIPGRDSVAVHTELERAGVICSPRMGLIRFSPHLFTAIADIDQALNALESIMSAP